MNTYQTIIDAETLLQMLGHPDLVVVDCRFMLSDKEKGRQDYRQSHIPGAFYAHLDEDLSGPVIPGRTGRHPLPPVEKCEQLFSSWGISKESQVVVYDYHHGGIAARLWWMLRWLGHDAVAVLNGGWAAWQARGLPADHHIPGTVSGSFRATPDHSMLVDVTTVEQMSHAAETCLIDARLQVRYQGQEEPIDPVAGHIPGAKNSPFSDNVDAEGYFKSKEELRSRFSGILKGKEAADFVCYCGSGVTACHNLLALKHAGLGDARLYAGSWSHWITDPGRGVETGN